MRTIGRAVSEGDPSSSNLHETDGGAPLPLDATRKIALPANYRDDQKRVDTIFEARLDDLEGELLCPGVLDVRRNSPNSLESRGKCLVIPTARRAGPESEEEPNKEKECWCPLFHDGEFNRLGAILPRRGLDRVRRGEGLLPQVH
jgi:hypothetical protein